MLTPARTFISVTCGCSVRRTPKSRRPIRRFPPERHDFVLREAGKADGLTNSRRTNERLGEGKHYTVVVYEDQDAKPVLRVFNDDETAPAAGKAKVRVIHAAPAMESVSIYAAGHKNKLAGESRVEQRLELAGSGSGQWVIGGARRRRQNRPSDTRPGRTDRSGQAVHPHRRGRQQIA